MVRSEEGVTLFLNKELYKKDAIDLVIGNFADVCEIENGEESEHHLVRFSGLPPDELEEVALEFSNHALAMMKG